MNTRGASSSCVAYPVGPDQGGTYASALARWDDEGGAGAEVLDKCAAETSAQKQASLDAALVRLHARVIALERLMIVLLSRGSHGRRQQARAMASLIVPRDGATPHRLTIGAAVRMRYLVERADGVSKLRVQASEDRPPYGGVLD